MSDITDTPHTDDIRSAKHTDDVMTKEQIDEQALSDLRLRLSTPVDVEI